MSRVTQVSRANGVYKLQTAAPQPSHTLWSANELAPTSQDGKTEAKQRREVLGRTVRSPDVFLSFCIKLEMRNFLLGEAGL